MWPCCRLLLWLGEPSWSESCDKGPALCHCPLVHPGPSAQRAGKLRPSSRRAQRVRCHADCAASAPQERVQAADLVKMLFSTEEGDLLREPEQELLTTVTVGKDEL